MPDPDLFRLLAAETKSTSVHIEDTGERLIAHPLGYPMGWIWPFLALPFAAFLGAFVYLLGSGQLDWLGGLIFGVMEFMSPFIITLILAIIRTHNDQQTAPGPFFVLDRSARTLTLPRLDRTLSADDILGFAQVHE